MNRNEQEYYANINGIARALDRIANALENNNLTAQEAHNVKHAFTGPNGEQVDKIYYKTRKDMFADNPCTKEEYEAHKANNIPGFEGTLDALDNLCNVGTNPKNDPERDKFKDDLSVRYKDKIKEFPKVEVDFRENHIMCPDLDLRETARMYTEELEAGNFNTKKECILDYVTNEFGSHGARYTDIIKFAYYLGQPDAVRYSNADRGYYSCAISGRNAHLVGGGKDFLVKGINREGDERYFTHSFVESVTDYWKYI